MPTNSLTYPKFHTAMLRPNRADTNGKTRFIVDFRGPFHVAKSYEFVRYSFYVPAKFVYARDLHLAKIGSKIHDILRACALDEHTDCWHWVGQKNGSYPSTYFLGKPRGAMKVLLALLTEDNPEHFQTRRLCNSSFCINPRHHRINCNYNIPIDPIFLAKEFGIPETTITNETNIFWTHPEVLPWQPFNGIATLTPEETAQLPTEEKKTFLPPQFSSRRELKEIEENVSISAVVAEDEKWRRVAQGKLALTLETTPIPIVETSPTEWIKDYNTVEKLQKLLPFLDNEEEIKLATQQLEILQMQELETKAKKKPASKEKTIKT